VDSSDRSDLSSLYLAITEDKGKPLDHWEIAALLEIYGVRDIDAKNEYGFENVFEMAKYMQQYIDIKTYPVKSLVKWEELPSFTVRIIKNYIRGLAFAMPMFVQIFFTLSIGYAIWSGINMDRAKATIIALGTFLALIVTGASAQAIGRKGLFYLKQKEAILASNVTKILVNVGIILVVVIGIILMLFNFFFEVLPSYYFFILIMFYFLLSFLFLNISVYYMFEEYTKILYFFLLGMILVYFAHSIFKIKLPEAQFVALVILDIILSIFAYRKVINLKKQLVADRIIAWSTNVAAKPYFIWFDVPYELGLDWALIALVLLMGLTEISIHEFMYRINDLVIQYKYRDYKKFNNAVYSFFKKFNLTYLFLSIIIILITYFSVFIAYKITDLGSISYAFMVNGLMNVLFIFSFSRQNYSVFSIMIATFANIIVGMILSRMFGLEFAVIGLLVGSVLFWWLSFKYSVDMLKKLEFYYYSSF